MFAPLVLQMLAARSTRPLTLTTAVVILSAAVLACSSAPASAPVRTPGTTRAAASPASTAALGSVAGARSSIMQVNIGSGKDKGSHYAFSGPPTCTYGVAGKDADRADTWSSVYLGAGDDLSVLSVVVPKGALAKVAEGNPNFTFNANVRGTSYAIDSGTGSANHGLAKIVDFGSTAVIGVTGKTADGTPIDVTIQCNVSTGPDGQPRH